MTRPLVLYHDNCPDGFTAAWVAWTKFGDDAEYHAVNYGQPVPDVDVFRPVYILDFSWPRGPLAHFIEEQKALVTVLDHHKTAEAELAGLPGCVFDMDESGASLAWRFFHPGESVPELVTYVADRDLWRWKLAHSREVSEYLFSVERTFVEWNRAAARIEMEFDAVVGEGQALLRAKRQRVAKVCENVRWITLAGHDIPVVNTAWDFSEIGEFLCERFPYAPCGGYYFDRQDRRQWGFRSRGEFDVSALCKQYGGGGHRAAAGFTSDLGWWPEDKSDPASG